MSQIVEYKVKELLFKNNIINSSEDADVNVEISNLLEKDRIISLHKAKLNMSDDLSKKELYLKLIDSLTKYTGKNIFLVFLIHNSFQETYFIDEDLKVILCCWR